jgi:hypothetical protein
MGALRHLGRLIESEIQGELAKIDWGKFRVQLIAQDEGKELGRDAAGGLPVRVVGHEKMGKAAYEAWALETLTKAYGAGYAARTVGTGIDLKEFGPAGMIGRQWQRFESAEDANAPVLVRHLVVALEMIEKYPQLYNVVALEMRGKEPVTVEQFIEQLMKLPNPMETGAGRFATLGDLIAKNVSMLPGF